MLLSYGSVEACAYFLLRSSPDWHWILHTSSVALIMLLEIEFGLSFRGSFFCGILCSFILEKAGEGESNNNLKRNSNPWEKSWVHCWFLDQKSPDSFFLLFWFKCMMMYGDERPVSIWENATRNKGWTEIIAATYKNRKYWIKRKKKEPLIFYSSIGCLCCVRKMWVFCLETGDVKLQWVMSMYSCDPLMYLMWGSSFIVANMLAIKYTAVASLVASKCSYLHHIFPSSRWVRTVISKYQYLLLTTCDCQRSSVFRVRAPLELEVESDPSLLWKALCSKHDSAMCEMKLFLFGVWCLKLLCYSSTW